MNLPRRVHRKSDGLPDAVLSTVRNGVEANKTAAQIRRELAGMGFTFPERTVARWAREAHAERFRVRASATLPGLVSQQSGWRVEELLDMIRGADGKVHMTVLGKGNMDYGPIMRAATGLKYYFVEQEQFDMEEIEELRLDAEYMRKLNA